MLSHELQQHVLEAAEWAADLFKRRTLCLVAGAVPRCVEEIDPRTRVQWTEVTNQFPTLRSPSARQAFQPAWETALRRRGLLGVLRGRVPPEAWAAAWKRSVKEHDVG